jgi:hypothetical protein
MERSSLYGREGEVADPILAHLVEALAAYPISLGQPRQIERRSERECPCPGDMHADHPRGIDHAEDERDA